MRQMSSGLLRQWQRRLLRYISSLASLGLGQWQSVINQLVNSAESKPIGLFGMFEFHHLISGWRLDGQQHDVAAADFLAHLQRSLRDAWIP